MKKALLLPLIIIFSLLSQNSYSQNQDSIYFQRLFHLGKIWGFVKYHHSEIANGNINWNQELVDRLPGIKTAPSNKAFNDSIMLLINSAGETAIGQGEIPEFPDSLNLVTDWSWMDDEFLSTEVRLKLQYIHEQFRPMNHITIEEAFEGGNIVWNEYYDHVSYYPDEPARILALYMYWNIINYYYPYKHIMDKNWNEIFIDYLPEIINSQNREEYHLAFRRLSANINDSHSYMYSWIYRDFRGTKYTPFSTQFINNKMVVTKVLPSETNVKPGDILLEIDDVTISYYRDSLRAYAFGSNTISIELELSDIILFGDFGYTNVKVTNGIDTSVYSTKREDKNDLFLDQLTTTPIWYDTVIDNSCSFGIVDMGRLQVNHVDQMFADFMSKDAIIFDQRNYPNGTIWEIVNYIYSEPINIANFTVPDITFPGKLNIFHYHIGEGTAEPYNGKIIILFNEETISQAEFTIMGLEQHPNSIKIGSETQAADGNVSSFGVPGVVTLNYTGLGVFYNDFTPTQRVGIIPDYYVRPTIEGIRSGKDEVLEFALNCSVGIEELFDDFILDIYPNPSDSEIQFEISGVNIIPKSIIKLTNIQGQTVSKKSICNLNGYISTKNLPNGVYIFSISNNSFRKTKKIIINH